MREIRDQSRRERIRDTGPKELESCPGEDGRERSESGAYEEPWQLAKSLGFAPGENYSRYEFTVGAGLRGRKKNGAEEKRAERVQRIAVESSGQIRQESRGRT